MRAISGAASGELTRQHGSFPARILSVSWDGLATTLYGDSEPFGLSDGAGGTIAVGSGVASWPTITQGGDDPAKIAAAADVSVTLEDADGAFAALLDTALQSATGIYRVRVGLYLFWRSHLGLTPLAWPADRLELFDGCLESYSLDHATRLLTLKLTSWHLRYPALLGVRVTRQHFPESPIERDGKAIIPLVFGESVRRVPGVLIDRPGQAFLAESFFWYENFLRINQPADEVGFPLDEEIDITVGVPGNFETMTGTFFTADPTLFVIADRSHQYAHGAATVSEGAICLPRGGIDVVLLPWKDASGANIMPGGTASKAGFMVAVFVDGAWIQTMATRWTLDGARYVIPCAKLGAMVASGTTYYEWAISAAAASSSIWAAGCVVGQIAPWVLAVNSFPSLSVDRVEFRQSPNGLSRNHGPRYFTLREDQYEVTLDNTDFNLAIGRQLDEPGLTTISLATHPAAYGMESDAFATLSGVVDPDGPAFPDEEPLTTCGPIIKFVLTNPRLAALPESLIDLASLTGAQQAIDERESSGPLAFAIREQISVWEVVEQIAAQSTCRLRIEGGRVALQAVPDYASNTVANCSDANSIAFESVDALADALPLRVIADVPRYVNDSLPSRIAGVVNGASRFVSEKRWAWGLYQNVSDAVPAHQWWQRWLAERQRQSTAKRFIDAAGLTVLDPVGVTIGSASTGQLAVDQTELSEANIVTLTGSSRITAVELDAVTAPAGVILSTFDRDSGLGRDAIPNERGWQQQPEQQNQPHYPDVPGTPPPASPVPGFEDEPDGFPPCVIISGALVGGVLHLNRGGINPANHDGFTGRRYQLLPVPPFPPPTSPLQPEWVVIVEFARRTPAAANFNGQFTHTRQLRIQITKFASNAQVEQFPTVVNGISMLDQMEFFLWRRGIDNIGFPAPRIGVSGYFGTPTSWIGQTSGSIIAGNNGLTTALQGIRGNNGQPPGISIDIACTV